MNRGGTDVSWVFTKDDSDFNSIRRFADDLSNDVGICDNPLSGYGVHTCADQNNRTFFSVDDFGRRGVLTSDLDQSQSPHKATAEQWDMRWSWTKAAQSSGNYWYYNGLRVANSRAQGRTDQADPDHVENDWKWGGPNLSGDTPSFPGDETQQLDSAVIYMPNKDVNSHYETDCSNDAVSMEFPSNVFDASTSGTCFDTSSNPDFFFSKEYYCADDDFLQVSASARGCHMPANPMWAWPGLVVNQKGDRSTNANDVDNTKCSEYTDETHPSCKIAAWAPPISPTPEKRTDGHGKQVFPKPNWRGCERSDGGDTAINDIMGIWPKNAYANQLLFLNPEWC